MENECWLVLVINKTLVDTRSTRYMYFYITATATPERVLPVVTSTIEEFSTPMEKLHVVAEDTQENEHPLDTPSGDEESFFVDAQSDTDSSNLNNSVETPDNLDTVSCDTTDTESTGNTVVGATF